MKLLAEMHPPQRVKRVSDEETSTVQLLPCSDLQRSCLGPQQPLPSRSQLTREETGVAGSLQERDGNGAGEKNGPEGLDQHPCPAPWTRSLSVNCCFLWWFPWLF